MITFQKTKVSFGLTMLQYSLGLTVLTLIGTQIFFSTVNHSTIFGKPVKWYKAMAPSR